MDRIFGILVAMVISTGGNTDLPVKETATSDISESASETLELDEETTLTKKTILKQDEQH